MALSNIVIISGPSGAGEDSVIEGLRKYATINRVITTSTRAPRPGESDGNPYYFVSHKEFERRIAEGAMIEWARQYNDELYGVTQAELERVNALPGLGVWKLEYQGVISARKLFPEIRSILLMAESIEVLEQRIRSRDVNVDDAFVQNRMQYTQEWLKHTDAYDYTVINKQGALHETILQVVDILRKEQYL